MVGLGFFPDREAGEAHVEQMEALHDDPGRKDLAWKLGVDKDVMDTNFRRTEVRNWIEKLVKPTMAERG